MNIFIAIKKTTKVILAIRVVMTVISNTVTVMITITTYSDQYNHTI